MNRAWEALFGRINYLLPGDAVQDCFFRARDCIIAGPVTKPKDSARHTRADAISRDRRSLLERILDTPHLAHVVPRLQPEVLHKVIETCGLEDCGDLVALATPDQLQRVFDLDLWRPPQPGLDERLDPQRFAVWLEVLMESGAAVAAEKLIGVDIDLVIASLAQHVLVMDYAAVAPFTTLDGEHVAPYQRPPDRLARVVGGYHIETKDTDAWDAIIDLLVFLGEEHSDYFHRLMGGCRALSNSRPEEDGFHDLLTDNEQDMFDLTVDRDRRREQQGYVTPAQARAFLQSARDMRLEPGGTPPSNPVARAYFREMESRGESDAATQASETPAAPPETNDGVGAVMEVLFEAGVLTGQPRALLGGAVDEAPRLTRLQALMQFAAEHDQAAFSRRTAELAYLANTIVAGCSIQARPFTAREASDAAAATCNLGLENWPGLNGEALPGRFLVEHDLVSAFQVGWRILYADVCLFAATALVRILGELGCGDRDLLIGLGALRLDLSRQCQAGTPWRARDALDVIAILDLPAWAALLGLIDECPFLHDAIGASQTKARSINPSGFAFISESNQIASVHAFMNSLPEILRG